MCFSLYEKIILTVFYKIYFLSVNVYPKPETNVNPKRVYFGYFNRFISDKLFYFVIYYYYLASCTTFPHLPAPTEHLQYLLSPFFSVIPVFFH